MANFHTYRSLHIFIDYMGGCELPTKWIATMSDNDSNDSGNMSKSSITLLGSCAKLNIFLINAYWHFFPLWLNTLI
jgi:hypothetical protein